MISSHGFLGRGLWPVLAALFCAACGDGFPKYNHLDGFRVLALRASPPTLSAGESTTLDALTFVEGETTPGPSYNWSWCPARLPSAGGGDCALDESQFAALLGLDPSGISFALGTGETAQFAYPGDPEAYRAACENTAGAASQGAFVFSCKGGFPISIRADITYGDKTIRVQKDLRLLFGDLPPNKNPELGAISFMEVGSDVPPEPWPQDSPARLTLGHGYQLRVEVDETTAELFVPTATLVDPVPKERHESLYISWFTSSGEHESDRTTFIEGGWSLAEFGRNTLQLPKPGDEPHDTARTFLVLRDERGGVSWLVRAAELSR